MNHISFKDFDSHKLKYGTLLSNQIGNLVPLQYINGDNIIDFSFQTPRLIVHKIITDEKTYIWLSPKHTQASITFFENLMNFEVSIQKTAEINKSKWF